MNKNTNKTVKLPPYVLLCLVAVVMSFAISGVYSITKGRIDAAALEAQLAARKAVMEEAVSMDELPLAEDAPVDCCLEARDADGAVIGYISQITVTGFGGEIEVTVGMDMTGSITAIQVGGANFSETSGLGAKTRDAAFTDQFKGMSGLLVLKQNVDSVTGASVSSGAVVSGVNKALTYMTALLPESAVSAPTEELPLTAEQIAVLLPGASEAVWMGSGSGIDGWWKADNGYIVRATAFGEGPIVVTMGFTAEGTAAGIIIGDENFMETEGRGALVQEEYFWSQFIGRSGVQTFGEGLDAISGATVTSDATLEAINACFAFDPSAPAAAEKPAASGETASPEPASAEVTADPLPPLAAIPDAETGASVEEEPLPTPEPTPDAMSQASVEEEVIPTPEPTPQAVDARTEASVAEETVPTPEPTPDAESSASVEE